MFNTSGLENGQSITIEFHQATDFAIRLALSRGKITLGEPLPAIFIKQGNLTPTNTKAVHDSVYLGNVGLWPHEDGQDYKLIDTK